MKKIAALFSLILLATLVQAQVAPPNNRVRGSSFQDSVRAQQETAKITVVNGLKINSAMDFVENLTPAKNYTILVNALRAASLIGTLKSRGPLTFFIPDDSAFRAKFSNARIDSLMKPKRKYELINLLTYHIVAGNYDSKAILELIEDGHGQAQLLTLSGSKLTAKIDNNRNIVLYDETGGQSIVSKFDMQQSNGYIHMITNVLIPKNKAI